MVEKGDEALKRCISFIVMIGMIFLLGACSSVNDSDLSEDAEGSEVQTENRMSQNTLIAYFTWAENTEIDENSSVDATTSPSVVVPGNVQQLAGWIQEETGGDLFSIQTTDPYPSDWDACLDRANEERANDARPDLREKVDELERYDTVFLGYPNWWYGVPMPVLSFLEQNDLSGKEVILFCSHGTGGLADSVDQIREALPETNVSENIFDCHEEEVSSSKNQIQEWIQELGYYSSGEEIGGEEVMTTRMAVKWEDKQIVYELNDSLAAQSLIDQLPLTVEIDNYSNNEKIFYPKQELEISQTPLAQGGSGILAYYAPWNDIVFFYDDFQNNSNLYELGEIVSGEEWIRDMSGTVSIERLD